MSSLFFRDSDFVVRPPKKFDGRPSRRSIAVFQSGSFMTSFLVERNIKSDRANNIAKAIDRLGRQRATYRAVMR